MSSTEIQFESDENGNTVGVIVPIELWRESESERERQLTFSRAKKRRRLLEVKNPQKGTTFEEAREKLGI